MKKLHFIPVIFIVFLSCTGNDKQTPAASSANSVKTEKHVYWEIGPDSNVNKIAELYRLWDEKKTFAATDYFADTFNLNTPEAKKERVVPNDQISTALGEARNSYNATSNAIISSVSLRDKVTGEDWVMVTAYSKWTEKDGTKDSVLYHEDWRLKNGKINLLLSFYKIPPKGFSIKKDK